MTYLASCAATNSCTTGCCMRALPVAVSQPCSIIINIMKTPGYACIVSLCARSQLLVITLTAQHQSWPVPAGPATTSGSQAGASYGGNALLGQAGSDKCAEPSASQQHEAGVAAACSNARQARSWSLDGGESTCCRKSCLHGNGLAQRHVLAVSEESTSHG